MTMVIHENGLMNSGISQLDSLKIHFSYGVFAFGIRYSNAPI